MNQVCFTTSPTDTGMDGRCLHIIDMFIDVHHQLWRYSPLL